MRKFYTTPSVKLIHFFIKVPRKDRATFAIIKREGKRNQTVQSDLIKSLNQQFLSKQLTLEQTHQHFKHLVEQFYEAQGKAVVQYFADNEKVVETYWQAEYVDRDLVAPSKSKDRLYRAIAALGHCSLRSASRQEMQSEIDSKLKGNKQRAVVASVNQLLKFLKRSERLRRVREEVRDVRYLTLEQFKTAIEEIKDPLVKLLCQVAFGTGGRIGELFAIRPDDIKESGLFIQSQLDEQGTIRLTKNRRKRTAFIVPGFESYLDEWAAVPMETRLIIRNLRYSKIIREASKKDCVFHDLRHSYAKHLIANGFSLTLISKLLGITIFVAEKHYAGRETTPEDILLAKAIMSRS